MSPDPPGRAPRDWRLFLDDIVEACDKIQGYVAGLTLGGLVGDTKTYDAVLFNLQVIGEATKRPPPSVLAAAPHMPWRDIAGMRNRIAHGYFEIDDRIVWDVVTTEIEPLRTTAVRLRDATPPPSETA